MFLILTPFPSFYKNAFPTAFINISSSDEGHPITPSTCFASTLHLLDPLALRSTPVFVLLLRRDSKRERSENLSGHQFITSSSPLEVARRGCGSGRREGAYVCNVQAGQTQIPLHPDTIS